jgi:hypothetical protein
MSENILTIRQYFNKGTFVIPNYQRGYKWSVPDVKGNCKVSNLMDNLLDAFFKEASEYFIQGVTIYEEDTQGKLIHLVDGQQRTTTFFLLLKYLEYESLPVIHYKIREESDHFLKESIVENGQLIIRSQEDYQYDRLQDIHYFRKAITTIHERLNGKYASHEKPALNDFRNFILDKVKLFYIAILPDKATKVFAMLNGQKAFMKTDELVKAALLSKSSRANYKPASLPPQAEPVNALENLKIKMSEEWEINALRSRYAREWDKWLYWWNKPDVKDFYGSGSNPMGLLLEYFFYRNGLDYSNDEKYVAYTYKEFALNLLDNNGNGAKVKQLFKEVRDLQKTFEDLFNKNLIYNSLGLIFRSNITKKEALNYFLDANLKEAGTFQEYAKWALIGATHRQIVTKSEELQEDELKEDKAAKVYQMLSGSHVYWNENNTNFPDNRVEMAFRQLLRRNVELDNELGRKFNFGIYDIRSLEHIWPKSKILEIPPEDKAEISVHCIGNLVLLSGPDNSSFNDKDPEEKKSIFFNYKNVKKSMALLHSLIIFSNKSWGIDQIKANKADFLENFKTTYKLKK